MGLLAQDVHPDALPETLPPGSQENPTLLFFGEPRTKLRRALSCPVTGDVEGSFVEESQLRGMQLQQGHRPEKERPDPFPGVHYKPEHPGV